MSILNIKFDLVEVTWDDASSLEHGWVDPADEKPQPQLVKTVGFLVNESEHYLVIASTTDGNWVNGRFQIPRGMVKSIKPLRRKRKAKEGGIARAAIAGATSRPAELVAAKPLEAALPKPLDPKPAEALPAAKAPPAPTVLEDLLVKAGAAAAAMRKSGKGADSADQGSDTEEPRAA